jgi:hypothetical protein
MATAAATTAAALTDDNEYEVDASKLEELKTKLKNDSVDEVTLRRFLIVRFRHILYCILNDFYLALSPEMILSEGSPLIILIFDFFFFRVGFYIGT